MKGLIKLGLTTPAGRIIAVLFLLTAWAWLAAPEMCELCQKEVHVPTATPWLWDQRGEKMLSTPPASVPTIRIEARPLTDLASTSKVFQVGMILFILGFGFWMAKIIASGPMPFIEKDPEKMDVRLIILGTLFMMISWMGVESLHLLWARIVNLDILFIWGLTFALAAWPLKRFMKRQPWSKKYLSGWDLYFMFFGVGLVIMSLLANSS